MNPRREGPDRGRRPLLVEEFRAGSGAQHVHVRDRLAPGEHRADHAHRLGATIGAADRVCGQFEMLVDQFCDTQPLGQGGGCEQSCVGDEVVLVEGGFDRGQIVR